MKPALPQPQNQSTSKPPQTLPEPTYIQPKTNEQHTLKNPKPTQTSPEARDHMPSSVMAFTPDTLPRITPDALAAALPTSKRGSAPGLSGMRAEHLQVLLQDARGSGTARIRGCRPKSSRPLLWPALRPSANPMEASAALRLEILSGAGLARPCEKVRHSSTCCRHALARWQPCSALSWSCRRTPR